MNVVETRALGKSYGSTRALRRSALAIPDGHHRHARRGRTAPESRPLLNLAVSFHRRAPVR